MFQNVVNVICENVLNRPNISSYPRCSYLHFCGVLQLCEDPVPVGEALAALDAGGHLVVFDLPVENGGLGSQLAFLHKPHRALVALLAADACIFGTMISKLSNMVSILSILHHYPTPPATISPTSEGKTVKSKHRNLSFFHSVMYVCKRSLL